MDPTKKRKQPDRAFYEDPNLDDEAVSKREGNIQDLRLKNRNAIEQGLQKFHRAETPVIKATAEIVEQPLAGPSSEGSTTLPPDQQQQSGLSEHEIFLMEALEMLNNNF